MSLKNVKNRIRMIKSHTEQLHEELDHHKMVGYPEGEAPQVEKNLNQLHEMSGELDELVNKMNDLAGNER